TPTLGLEPDELDRFLAREGVRKVSARDLAPAIVRGADGATTVAASLALAVAGGFPVFATGGIGGVHRDAPFDESADLGEPGRARRRRGGRGAPRRPGPGDRRAGRHAVPPRRGGAGHGGALPRRQPRPPRGERAPRRRDSGRSRQRPTFRMIRCSPSPSVPG